MCVSQLCYQLSHFPSPIHIFYQIPPLGIRLLGPCFLSVTIVGTAVNNRHSALTHKPITHESYKLKKKKKSYSILRFRSLVVNISQQLYKYMFITPTQPLTHHLLETLGSPSVLMQSVLREEEL